MHLDIYARDLADLEAFGATVVEPRHGTRTWTVMADPEGGEFCAFLRSEIPAERLHGLVVDSDGDSYVAERSVGDGTVKVLTDTIQKERRGDGAVIWLTATYEVCGPDGEVGGVIIRNASGLYDVPEKAQRVGPTQAVAVALGREAPPPPPYRTRAGSRVKLVLVIPPCGFCWDRDARCEVMTRWGCWASLCADCTAKYDSGREEPAAESRGPQSVPG